MIDEVQRAPGLLLAIKQRDARPVPADRLREHPHPPDDRRRATGTGLVRRLPPWHANLGSRQIKTPKVYVVDSGLLAFLIGANEHRLTTDGAIMGPLLESFVAMEIARQAEQADDPVTLFHYRDKQQREVDVVLEWSSGEVAGIEVKAAATAASRDFAGLRYLRDKLGTRFKAGVVLYTGGETLPFGDRLTAVPLSGLWT